MTGQPLKIVGIGGAIGGSSSTDMALRFALNAIADRGGAVTMFGGDALAELPHYAGRGHCVQGRALLSAVRTADGVLIASPGYHGSVSGLVKNALDHLEEMATDDTPYLHGRPVGLIVTAYGAQALGSTLAALRAIVHALRGGPTPYGATINSSTRPFLNGRCDDQAVADQLLRVAKQTLDAARLRRIDVADEVGTASSAIAVP